MADRWALAFSIAVLLALGGGALLRRAARRQEVAVDIRRIGGVVLLAALVGWALAPRLSDRLVALAATVIAMAVVGLMADRGILRGRSVPAAILAVSILPVAAGVRFELLGVPGPDAVFTVLWIAGVTAAVAGLGNTDGLLATVAAGAAGGVFALGGFGGQDALATVAAALAGAAVGFLAYNVRPASLYVGQVGGLLAGVLLAVAAAELHTGIGAPESHLVPIILLGLPITDAIVVALGRLSYRKELTRRRPDHLPHRLRALGWSAGRVTAVLGVIQLALSGVALFVGRGVLPAAIGAAFVAVLLTMLTFVAVHGRVYRERRPGFSARVMLLFFGLGLLMVGAAVPAVRAGLEARDALTQARTVAERAISAARKGEPDVAAQKFREAAVLFAEARDHLYSPLVAPGLVVPVLGSNVHAMRTLSDAGLDLARAGERLTGPVDPEKLRVRNGTMDLAEVRRITPSLEEAAQLLTQTAERVGDLDRALLIEPVRDALGDVVGELARAERDAVRGAAAARIAPAVLGGEGSRRYFLAVQNPAELRATGGFIGNYGILTANNGRVDLEFIDRVRLLNQGGDGNRTITGPEEYLRRYSRFEPERTWQNVNMSPDAPTVGEVISELYPQSGGEAIDGVLFVDPKGLAALLELTGPVRVEDWPDPITAANVVDVTLRDAYQRFASTPDRADFLGDVARQAVDVATSGDLGKPAQISKVLGKASREGHLTLYFTRPEEEAIAEVLNADGAIPRANADSLMVVTQNAGANKIDYYLRRHLRTSLRIEPEPSGERARVRGRIEVIIENTAPDSGLPQSVIGPSEGLEDRFVAGENYAFVSVYTPFGVTAIQRDGAPIEVEEATELGQNVFSTWVSVRALSATTLTFDVEGFVPLERGGWYDLQLVRQPFLTADDVSIDLAVPHGWRIGRTEHVRATGERTAAGQVLLAENTPVRVRIEPAGLSLWDRLRHGA